MEIDEMKNSLERFAKDFTKLSEYFGVDDYDEIEAKTQMVKNIKISSKKENEKEYENKNENVNGEKGIFKEN
jgi:hypothetical protein